MPLTDVRVRRLKPAGKPVKHFDGRGLYLLVSPRGGRWWRFKYRFGCKERLLSLGTYPEVGLKEARERLDVARRQLRDGIDPSAARRADKAARADRAAGSFEHIARDWYAKQLPGWTPGYASKVLRRFEMHAFPTIGAEPIRDLTAPKLLAALRKVEARGTVSTANRVLAYWSAVFRYAVATHRADTDPTAALRGVLKRAPVKHHASITDPKQIGALMRALRGYSGAAVTRAALRLAPLLFVRPGELRQARWDEFSFDLVDPPPGKKPTHAEPQWRIPAERMKVRVQHVVPLSTQAVAILRELHELTGPDGLLFPGVRSPSRPMSENTINAALRRLDYGHDEMTGHGFRSMASTILHEQGWRSEVIERQLAHVDSNKVRAAYNYAEHLTERRRMMQAWADHLDALASGAEVVSIGKAKRA